MVQKSASPANHRLSSPYFDGLSKLRRQSPVAAVRNSRSIRGEADSDGSPRNLRRTISDSAAEMAPVRSFSASTECFSSMPSREMKQARAGVEEGGQRRLASGVPLRPNVVGEVAGYLREDAASLFQSWLGFLDGVDGSHILLVEPRICPVVGPVGNGHSDVLVFL
jgi:hypothetical protein